MPNLFSCLSKDVCVHLLTYCDCKTLRNIAELVDNCYLYFLIKNEVVDTLYMMLHKKYGKCHIGYSHKRKKNNMGRFLKKRNMQLDFEIWLLL